MEAEKIRFNAKVYIDFIYIKRAHVLQVVDDATRFIATQLVAALTTKNAMKTILTLRATVCTRLPNILDLDDGSQFRDSFVEICEIHDAE